MSRLKINLEAIERDGNNNAEGFCADGVRVGSLLVSSKGVQDSAGHSYVLSLSDFDVVPEAEGGFLGKGSSGSVRRAIHRRSGTVVALKEIKVAGQAHISEIRRELETLHAGDCVTPYLVNFYGAFTHEGSVYIAMEAMDGSLQEIVKPVPLPVLACMTRHMLKGLVYLHRTRHLMHRDLKPSNVLFNARTGDIKISDFGVSSFLECTKADAHSFVGTVTYMSPERLHGDSYSYGADVWSLGLVVAELAVGECPFAGLRGESSEGRFWALIQHLNSARPALELPGDMDRDLANFINSCVVKAPDQRATCVELLRHPFILKYATPSTPPAAGGGSAVTASASAGTSLLTPPVTGAASIGSGTARSPLLSFPVTRPFDLFGAAAGGGNSETTQLVATPVATQLTNSAISSPASSSPMEKHDGEADEDLADRLVIQQWLRAVGEQRAERRRQRGHGGGGNAHRRKGRQSSSTGPAATTNTGRGEGSAVSTATPMAGEGVSESTAAPTRGGGGGVEDMRDQGSNADDHSGYDVPSGETGSASTSREETMEPNTCYSDTQRATAEPSVNLDDELNKLLL